MLQSNMSRAALCIALLMGGLTTTPSIADWRADRASPGTALYAKAVGQECHVLSASEMAELDTYLASAGAEMKRSDPAFDFEGFKTKLYAEYVAKYSDPKACTAEAAADAKDALSKARIAMKTGKLLGTD